MAFADRFCILLLVWSSTTTFSVTSALEVAILATLVAVVGTLLFALHAIFSTTPCTTRVMGALVLGAIGPLLYAISSLSGGILLEIGYIFAFLFRPVMAYRYTALQCGDNTIEHNASTQRVQSTGDAAGCLAVFLFAAYMPDSSRAVWMAVPTLLYLTLAMAWFLSNRFGYGDTVERFNSMVETRRTVVEQWFTESSSPLPNPPPDLPLRRRFDGVVLSGGEGTNNVPEMLRKTGVACHFFEELLYLLMVTFFLQSADSPYTSSHLAVELICWSTVLVAGSRQRVTARPGAPAAVARADGAPPRPGLVESADCPAAACPPLDGRPKAEPVRHRFAGSEVNSRRRIRIA